MKDTDLVHLQSILYLLIVSHINHEKENCKTVTLTSTNPYTAELSSAWQFRLADSWMHFILLQSFTWCFGTKQNIFSLSSFISIAEYLKMNSFCSKNKPNTFNRQYTYTQSWCQWLVIPSSTPQSALLTSEQH